MPQRIRTDDLAAMIRCLIMQVMQDKTTATNTKDLAKVIWSHLHKKYPVKNIGSEAHDLRGMDYVYDRVVSEKAQEKLGPVFRVLRTMEKDPHPEGAEYWLQDIRIGDLIPLGRGHASAIKILEDARKRNPMLRDSLMALPGGINTVIYTEGELAALMEAKPSDKVIKEAEQLAEREAGQESRVDKTIEARKAVAMAEIMQQHPHNFVNKPATPPPAPVRNAAAVKARDLRPMQTELIGILEHIGSRVTMSERWEIEDMDAQTLAERLRLAKKAQQETEAAWAAEAAKKAAKTPA